MKNFQNVQSELKSKSRFFMIPRTSNYWFYDSHAHSLFSIEKKSYNELFKTQHPPQDFFADKSINQSSYLLNIFNNILKNQNDETNLTVQDNACTIMINTSNRCNLNCAYCYRNKKSPDVNNIETIRKTINWAMKKYKPNASKFDFTYSMSSESSVDLQILNKVLEDYVHYEPQEFYEKDILPSKITDFFKALHRDFDSVKPEIFENLESENCSSLVKILNGLLPEKNLYELLGMSIGMFRESMQSEIQNRNNYSAWKAYRVNRWILEVKYGEFIDFSKKGTPQYPSFSIFTNGTCASKDFIQLIKKSGINPLWISIDGPKEVHDYNRKFKNGNGSYDEIIKNIRIFKKEEISLCASAVLTSHYPNPLEIALHLKSLGFKKANLTTVRPGSPVSFTLENVDSLLKGYTKLFQKFKQDALINDFSLMDFLEDDYCVGPIKLILSRTKQVRRCNLDNQLVINAKGDIYNCLYFESENVNKIGNIDTEIKADDSDKSVASREPCSKCWARYLCGGTCFHGSLKQTGSLLGVEPVECKIRKHFAKLSLDFIIFCKENKIDL